MFFCGPRQTTLAGPQRATGQADCKNRCRKNASSQRALEQGGMMKGIILAAGKGLRLNGTSGNTPKCLIKIGECTLLERQIQSLRDVGIKDIVVVVGYEAERVQQTCDAQIRFVKNPFYEQTNSLMSLWLAHEYLADGFVVLNSDVLFHPQLLAKLIHS